MFFTQGRRSSGIVQFDFIVDVLSELIPDISHDVVLRYANMARDEAVGWLMLGMVERENNDYQEITEND